MTTKSDDLNEAYEAMGSVLDIKLGDMAEWKAFRAIGRALLAQRNEVGAAPEVRPPFRILPRPQAPAGVPPPYNRLAGLALEETGEPIPTPRLIEFIGKHRELGSDPEKAKINIISSLSKSKIYKSVPWGGGRAWWYVDRPVPAPKKGQGVLG